MLKWANSVETGASDVKLCSCDGTQCTEYNGTTFVETSQMLMERNEFSVHHGIICPTIYDEWSMGDIIRKYAGSTLMTRWKFTSIIQGAPPLCKWIADDICAVAKKRWHTCPKCLGVYRNVMQCSYARHIIRYWRHLLVTSHSLPGWIRIVIMATYSIHKLALEQAHEQTVPLHYRTTPVPWCASVAKQCDILNWISNSISSTLTWTQTRYIKCFHGVCMFPF